MAADHPPTILKGDKGAASGEAQGVVGREVWRLAHVVAGRWEGQEGQGEEEEGKMLHVVCEGHDPVRGRRQVAVSETSLAALMVPILFAVIFTFSAAIPASDDD